MSTHNDATNAKTFDPARFPMELHVPPGLEYVEESTLEGIRTALEDGLGVYVESCDGRAFVWPEDDTYRADHFFVGPARLHTFETAEEAADFASDLCE